jgi:tetratricopeptide (TPR) repeat protein
MSADTTTISNEEQEQVLQTIEMFEVITQANPHDCQSLEILKEAYQRLGRRQDSLVVARRLADTHFELGQYSAAMLEYEGILQKDPENAEIAAALGKVEAELEKNGLAKNFTNSAGTPGSDLDGAFSEAGVDGATLTTTAATQRNGAPGRAFEDAIALTAADDGNEPLAKFLIQHRLVGEEIVSSALERVHKKNRDLQPEALAASLLDEICRRGAIDPETLLCGILDRSKFAYIPLEYYDVDRSIVKMLPESLTLGRLIVPFDVISRTVMIATANPFDAIGKQAVQQLLDYNVQWHLAAPSAIFQVLAETYRLKK